MNTSLYTGIKPENFNKKIWRNVEV